VSVKCLFWTLFALYVALRDESAPSAPRYATPWPRGARHAATAYEDPMTTRVYQFHLDPPVEGERDVRQQMDAAHRYANDLVVIERGRRDACRAVHDVPAVRQAVAALQAATRSDRRAAVQALWAARREAERLVSTVDEAEPGVAAATAALEALPRDAPARVRSRVRRTLKEARAAAGDEWKRIELLDESIRRDARALATCSWGTYLSVEASADQARKGSLYADDAVTPASPRFRRGGRREYLGDDRAAWWCAPGQVGMHVQGRVCRTSDVLAGRDAWVRIECLEPLDRPPEHRHARRGVLALRVDAGTWVRWPIRMHREVPDAAKWSWVRVSCRPQRGASGRESWTVEITVDDPAERPRDLAAAAATLSGAVAVELLWTPLEDGSMRAARWLDSSGQRGEVLLPRKLVRGLGEVPAGIRSVRDMLLNDFRPRLAELLRASAEPLPRWLQEAADGLHAWKSPSRFVELARRWRASRCDAARPAYELLDAWELRDAHLDDYEDGTRARSLRWRREVYRVLAAKWAQQYSVVLVPDRDLSREARWGQDSERRFLAAPQELRQCLRQAFGAGAVDAPWRGAHGVADEQDDAPEWLEAAVERWRGEEEAGGARVGKKESGNGEIKGSAWQRRQQAARERDEKRGGARKEPDNDA
jgi:hypothetical protein